MFLICGILAGCGGSSSGRFDSGPPPSNRTAYVAWKEWTKFGHSTVVRGGSANGLSNRSGVSERSEPLSSRIGDYWGSCGHPEWNGRSSSQPWSGAFVTWVMANSGVSPRDFPRDGRHGGYLSTLYDNQRSSRRAGFALHAPSEYAPKPGDLVCSGTSGTSWRHADSTMARRRIDGGANHCDVVTDVRGGYLHAVGGNVKDSVTMTLYPVDSRGRLVAVSGHPWMLVVENRVN